MKLSAGEALGLHEVLQELATCMEKLSFYAEEVQDEELRHLITDELHGTETNYREIRELADGSGVNTSYSHYEDGSRMGAAFGSQHAAVRPIQPRPSGRLSDRAIVTDILSGHKAFAVQCTWIATEMSHQTIRRALADMSRSSLDEAFKIYQYMEHRGWYPSFKSPDSPRQWLTETHRGVSEEHQPYQASSSMWQA